MFFPASVSEDLMVADVCAIKLFYKCNNHNKTTLYSNTQKELPNSAPALGFWGFGVLRFWGFFKGPGDGLVPVEGE